jgi:hypothetical protein
MHPLVRRLLLCCAIAAAAWVLYALSLDRTALSIGWGFGLGLMGIALISFTTASRRVFVAPVVFAANYLLGVVVAFGGLVQDPSSIPRAGFRSIGRFDFTNGAFVWPAEVICAGLLGIVVATLAAERWVPRSVPVARVMRLGLVPMIASWALFSTVLIGACAALGLGRTGLNNGTELPFALGGLLVYLRDFLFPALAALVLDAAVRARRTGLVYVVLALMLVLGVASSIFALSRARFVMAMMPAALLALRGGDEVRWFRRRASPVLGLFVLSSTLIISRVDTVRRAAFTSGTMTAEETVTASERDDASEGSGWQRIGALATDRVGGARELLAVSGSRARGLDAVWGIVEGDGTWVERVTVESFGFLPASNRSLAFGISLGLWGTLSLADSWLFVFLASALLIVIPLVTEIVFARLGQGMVGQMLSLQFVLVLWGGPQTFTVSRVIAVVLMAIAVILLSTKRPPQTSRLASGASSSLRHDPLGDDRARRD